MREQTRQKLLALIARLANEETKEHAVTEPHLSSADQPAPADPKLSTHLIGRLKGLQTMLANEWTNEHAAAAELQLEVGQVTPLVKALFVIAAFEEADAIARALGGYA